jgi:hypothetical protein
MGSDLDSLIRRSDPLWSSDVPDGKSASASQLYEHLLTEVVLGPTAPSRIRRGPLTLVGTAALVVVAVVLVIVLQTSPPVSAAAELSHLANVAEAQPGPQLGSGQSLYSVRSGVMVLTFFQVNGSPSAGAQASFTISQETWTQTDGTIIFRDRYGRAQFASPAAQSAWTGSGLPDDFSSSSPRVGIQENGGLQTAALNVASLPTTPTDLRAVLSTGKTGIAQIDDIAPGPDAMGQRISLLLLGPDSGATPQLYSALLRILSTVPGVQPVGTLTTHSGGSGIGFSLPGGASQDQERLIVDPQSGELLEAQNVPLGSSNGSLLYSGPLIDQLLDQMPEPRTLGSPAPTRALWIDALTTDETVSNGSLPTGLVLPPPTGP